MRLVIFKSEGFQSSVRLETYLLPIRAMAGPILTRLRHTRPALTRSTRDRVMGESQLHKMIGDHGFTIANLSSRLSEGGQQFEYRMTIKSRDAGCALRLSSCVKVSNAKPMIEAARRRMISTGLRIREIYSSGTPANRSPS